MSVLREMIEYFENRGLLDPRDRRLASRLGLSPSNWARQEWECTDEDWGGKWDPKFQRELWELELEFAVLSTGDPHDEDSSVLLATDVRRLRTRKRGIRRRRRSSGDASFDVEQLVHDVADELARLKPLVALYLVTLSSYLSPTRTGELASWVHLMSQANSAELMRAHTRAKTALKSTLGVDATLDAVVAFWSADPFTRALEKVKGQKNQERALAVFDSGPVSKENDWFWSHQPLLAAYQLRNLSGDWIGGRSTYGLLVGPSGDVLGLSTKLYRYLDCETEASRIVWDIRSGRRLGKNDSKAILVRQLNF